MIENLIFLLVFVALCAYPVYEWVKFNKETAERDHHLSNANLAFYDSKGNLIAYNRCSDEQPIPASHL